MSLQNNKSFNELYKGLFFDGNTPKYDFLKCQTLMDNLTTFIFGKEYDNKDYQEDNINFEINPPEMVPLTRQTVIWRIEDFNNDLKKSLKINKLQNYEMMITKYLIIDRDYDFAETGTIYITYIMRTSDETYYSGTVLIPSKWDGSNDSLTIFKSHISLFT